MNLGEPVELKTLDKIVVTGLPWGLRVKSSTHLRDSIEDTYLVVLVRRLYGIR
jgi:hypothetical protein